MVEWLKENANWVIPTLVGALAVFLVYLWERKPKRLDYIVTTNARVVAYQPHPMRDHLKVSFKGQELKEPRIVIVRVKNTGRVPVEHTDYKQPITVRLSKAVPLDGFIAKESSKGLISEVGLSLEGKEVLLVPELMNTKEWFDVQIVCDGQPGEIQVSCRFTGQTRPMRDAAPNSPLPGYVAMIGFICFIGGLIGTSADGGVAFERISVGGLAVTFLGFITILFQGMRAPLSDAQPANFLD